MIRLSENESSSSDARLNCMMIHCLNPFDIPALLLMRWSLIFYGKMASGHPLSINFLVKTFLKNQDVNNDLHSPILPSMIVLRFIFKNFRREGNFASWLTDPFNDSTAMVPTIFVYEWKKEFNLTKLDSFSASLWWLNPDSATPLGGPSSTPSEVHVCTA